MEKTVIICDLCKKEIRSFHTLSARKTDLSYRNFHVGFECEEKLIKDLIMKLKEVGKEE